MSCKCEDRPACGCLSESGYYDYTDPHDYADEQREKMFADDDGCEMCNVLWNKQDNEDDITQGFHAECADTIVI
jgi:hypothetical protein